MFSVSLKDSIKFMLFLFSYLGYTFVLYFAISLSLQRLNDNKNDFPSCRHMYVYSAIFLGLYLVDAIRYIIYLSFTFFSHKFASKTGSGMFIVNSVLLSYGVLLVYTTDKYCLTQYDIKDYLCASGTGLLFSVITYIYCNYDTFWEIDKKSHSVQSSTQSLLYDNV